MIPGFSSLGRRGVSGGIGARGAETGGGAVAAAANRGRTMSARNLAGVHKKSQRLSPLARMLDVSLSLLQRTFSSRAPKRLNDRQRAADFLLTVASLGRKRR